jgi:para-aminobenzoate synthetase component 1
MNLCEEIAWRDPAEAFARWVKDPYLAWLDSAAPQDARSRYSYLGVSPFQVIETFGGSTRINGVAVTGDPFTVLARELERWRLPPGAAPAPFGGGAIGFLGYELAGYLERLPQRHANTLAIPDMVVGCYDLVLVFDHRERRAWIVSSGFPSEGEAARQRRAAQRMTAALRRLNAPMEPPQPPARQRAVWQPELSRSDYERRVGRILEFIRAGDIFQANFTMRHLTGRRVGLSSDAIYEALRAGSTAPFAAYLACGPRLALASASPERFLRLDPAGRIETRPIKGTRPRGATPAADALLRAELAASEKDRAENLMIVDLMRNDLGRVAEIGSVAAPTLFEIESFPAVHHLVSSVTGVLRPGLGPVDLLNATFPAGSITGAPKIRAMEIIDEIEVARRGPYCGTIAWIGFDGAMDSSVVIRTLVITPETVVAQAGGGIVADSDPAAEYEEMMVKVRPLLAAVSPP